MLLTPWTTMNTALVFVWHQHRSCYTSNSFLSKHRVSADIGPSQPVPRPSDLTDHFVIEIMDAIALSIVIVVLFRLYIIEVWIHFFYTMEIDPASLSKANLYQRQGICLSMLRLILLMIRVPRMPNTEAGTNVTGVISCHRHSRLSLTLAATGTADCPWQWIGDIRNVLKPSKM